MLSYIRALLPHNAFSYGNINILLGSDMIELYKYLVLYNEDRMGEFVRLVMTSGVYGDSDCILLMHISYIAKYGPINVSEYAAYASLMLATRQHTVTEDSLSVVRRYSNVYHSMLSHKLGYYHILQCPVGEIITYNDLVDKAVTPEEIKYLSQHINMNPIVCKMLVSETSSPLDKHIITSANWKLVDDIERYVIFCLYHKIEISLGEVYKYTTLTPGLVCIAVQYNIDIYERDIIPGEYNYHDMFMIHSIVRKSARDKAYKLLPSYVKSNANTQRLFK